MQARARGIGAAAVALGVYALMLASAQVGSSLPAVEVLPGLAGSRTNETLQRVPVSGVAALRDDYLAKVLGPGSAKLIEPASRPPAGGTRPARAVGTESTTTPGTTTTTTTTTTPGSQRRLIEPPLQFSKLAVAMEADRSSVHPGEIIHYRIIVTNIGNREWRGDLQLSSHIPFGTVDVTSPCGGDVGIDPDPDHPCVGPPVPNPGSPDGNVHQISIGYSGAIAVKNQFVASFAVRVNESTASGTDLRNHAHLDVVGDGEQPVTSNTVTVVVD